MKKRHRYQIIEMFHWVGGLEAARWLEIQEVYAPPRLNKNGYRLFNKETKNLLKTHFESKKEALKARDRLERKRHARTYGNSRSRRSKI